MSIDIYLRAERLAPLADTERMAIETIVEDANLSRLREWILAYDGPAYPDPEVDLLGRFHWSVAR